MVEDDRGRRWLRKGRDDSRGGGCRGRCRKVVEEKWRMVIEKGGGE